MRARVVALAALVIVGATACDRLDTSAGGAERTTPAGTGAAASADGICLEHGVLEAICTTCNPKLAPIFKAKGDWCAEHELPESVCPLCHPERGGRPPVDVTAGVAEDAGPADGLRVKLRSAGIAEEAGIVSVPAIFGQDESVVVATATIVVDNARAALVNVRASGVIRAFKAEIGAVVRKGAPLAEVESAEVAEARARVRASRARLAVAEANHGREVELRAQGITSDREAQAAEQAWREAGAEMDAALAALEMIGAGEGESGVYPLLAPIGGTVIARNFTVGAFVHGDDPVFEIVDTSGLWAEIDVPESQVGRVEPGQHVVIEVNSSDGREIEAILQYVAPVVDPRTRTARARAWIDNADGRIRANVYARARIRTQSAGTAALIPRDALQDAKGVSVVFVPVGDGEYETRRVSVTASDGPLLAVTAGLEPGEPVVTTGSFILKTEILKGSIGAGCCDAVEAR